MNLDELNARIIEINDSLKNSEANYQALTKAINDCQVNHHAMLGRLAEAEHMRDNFKAPNSIE